jgi:hypothetical protein
MTKDEALAFLDRNPRIRERLKAYSPDLLEKWDFLFLYGLAETHTDARINVAEVWKALRASHEPMDKRSDTRCCGSI